MLLQGWRCPCLLCLLLLLHGLLRLRLLCSMLFFKMMLHLCRRWLGTPLLLLGMLQLLQGRMQHLQLLLLRLLFCLPLLLLRRWLLLRLLCLLDRLMQRFKLLLHRHLVGPLLQRWEWWRRLRLLSLTQLAASRCCCCGSFLPLLLPLQLVQLLLLPLALLLPPNVVR